MNRRTGMRDRDEKRYVELWRDVGLSWLAIQADEPGAPDGLLWGPRMWPTFVENKSVDGLLSKKQIAWHAGYRGPAGSLVVVPDMATAKRVAGVR